MTTTRHIIDITANLVPGFEAEETSEAKSIAYEILEWTYVPDSGDAITAADRVVEALIKAGWRPTVEEPAAERMQGERLGVGNADVSQISAEPSDAEVRAAAEALDGHSWMTDPDEGSLCACGEVLAPSLEYAGDAYRSHIARAALVAARKASGR